MLNKLFLAFLLGTLTVFAGRYPNITDVHDIYDATVPASAIGACAYGQSIVIAPRIIATVSHGGLRADVESNEPICINGKNYTVIRKVEDGGLGFRDLTLLFLDRALEGIDICPVLKLDDGEVIPRDSRLHAMSIVSNNLILKDSNVTAIPHRLSICHYGLLNILRLDPNFNAVSCQYAASLQDKNQFIPTGGDSGSPCFASLNDGKLATAGIVSTVDDGDNASYTYIGHHLEWIKGIINRHYADQNQTHFEIKTVNAAQCNFQPEPLHLPTIHAKIQAAAEREAAVQGRDNTYEQNYAKHLQIQNLNDPLQKLIAELDKVHGEIYAKHLEIERLKQETNNLLAAQPENEELIRDRQNHENLVVLEEETINLKIEESGILHDRENVRLRALSAICGGNNEIINQLKDAIFDGLGKDLEIAGLESKIRIVRSALDIANKDNYSKHLLIEQLKIQV